MWTGPDDDPKIVRIVLSKPGLSAEDQVSESHLNSRTSSCANIDDVAVKIQRLFTGEAIDFSLDLVDLSLCSGFQQRVLRSEHRIPRGRVSSYQLIAEHLGKRKGARAVGNALASNPFPLIVPCHRAIRSDRYLGGYQGGLVMKRALLELEGIPFDDAGRVTCGLFHYHRVMPDKVI
jgi:methylated-DNA-[protein]-cysteine S-methyltransferase